MPAKARPACPITPRNRSSRDACDLPHACRELNLGPLEEQLSHFCSSSKLKEFAWAFFQKHVGWRCVVLCCPHVAATDTASACSHRQTAKVTSTLESEISSAPRHKILCYSVTWYKNEFKQMFIWHSKYIEIST